MSAPNTSYREIDKSLSVASSSDVYNGLVVISPRGGTEPFLATSPTKFLKHFTANEKPNAGDDISLNIALDLFKDTDKVLCVRANNKGTFGGSIVKSEESAIVENFSGIFSYSGSNSILNISSKLGAKLVTGSLIKVSSDDVLPTELASATSYFVYKLSNTQIKLCANLYQALQSSPTFVSITTSGTGNHTLHLYSTSIWNTFVVASLTSETLSISESLGKNLVNGQEVRVVSQTTLPTGLSSDTSYFVIKISNTIIKLASSRENAITGTAINISGNGTGVHYLYTNSSDSFDYIQNFTIDTGNNYIIVPEQLGSIIKSGDSVNLSTEGSLSGTGLTSGNTYYLVKASNTEFGVATSYNNATASSPVLITLSDTGTGKHYISKDRGAISFSSYSFSPDEIGLVFAKDVGKWSKSISSGSVKWRFEDNRENIPNTFKILVYKTEDLATAIETHIVSRKHMTDGAGNQLYVQDVIKSSEYINYIDNLSIDDDIFPLMNATPISLTGGDDGDPITDSTMIEALQKFRNSEAVLLDVLLDSGWSTPAYHVAMDELLKYRKDASGIACIPSEALLASDPVSASIAYKQSTNINSSYLWFYADEGRITDIYNNRDIWLPTCSFVARAINRNSVNDQIWYIPAGWKRGIVDALEVRVEFEKGERDLLDTNSINSLRFRKNKGISIGNQKTSLMSNSALSRANVRLMLNKIEPELRDGFETFEFEFNNEESRSDAQQISEDYLKRVKTGNGIYDFFVVCNKDNNSDTAIDNYEMVQSVFVKPTKGSEYLRLDIIITRTGTDFSVVTKLIG